LETQFKNGGLVYKSVCKTRFGTKYFQMMRALDNNVAGQAVVTDPEYTRKYEDNVVAGRRASETDDEEEDPESEHAVDPAGRSLSEILEENKKHILSTSCWKQIDKITKVLKPAVDLLKLADSDRLMSGKIYACFNRVHQSFLEVEEASPEFAGIATIWNSRWKRQHHPVYCMAHVLHPDHNESNPLSDPYMMSEVLKSLRSHFHTEDQRNAVHASLLRYLARQGHFSTLDAMGEKRAVWSDSFLKDLSPWQWWTNFLAVEPLLAKFAMRVLQLAISSSACERAFSKWSYVISKYRTRLSLSRQIKSIYLFNNWRLLQTCDEDKWYRSDSEDEDSEE
jgi:hypothetical protein